MRRCARVIRYVRQVENESRELPTYEGFIYTLEMTSKTWYTSMELRNGTQDYKRLAKQYAHTNEIADEKPTIDNAL